ncbi:hypothetical protein BDC45DRAFT_609745 [Circinella umbellata]|nr:hypothetical protein BDC45DRAFT_609745 [Circinella umbellata]
MAGTDSYRCKIVVSSSLQTCSALPVHVVLEQYKSLVSSGNVTVSGAIVSHEITHEPRAPSSSSTTTTALPLTNNNNNNDQCLLQANVLGHFYNAQAEDILTDDDLLDLFRIVKQILRKKPDTNRVAKLLFCITYALGDHVKFSKTIHDDRILFRDDNHQLGTVILPQGTYSCCSGNNHDTTTSTTTSHGTTNNSTITAATTNTSITNNDTNNTPYHEEDDQWSTSTSSLSRLLSNNGVDAPPPENNNTSTDSFRSYTQFPTPPSQSSSSSSQQQALPQQPHHQSSHPPPLPPPPPPQHHHFPLHQAQPSQHQEDPLQKYPYLHTLLSNALTRNTSEVLVEPKQRGFYYQDGQIAREPALLQRYAEQGVLTQASLMRKRKRQVPDFNFPYELATLPAPITKKPKVPHRHGEFEQRRDEIISRMRSITLSDLEQKAQRLPNDFCLAIEQAPNVTANPNRTAEEAADLLEPALRILTIHSNMKPHLDNGMNQNGIYYNADYFRLYLAFDQFQSHFATLYPNEVVKINEEQQQQQNEQQNDNNNHNNPNTSATGSTTNPSTITTTTTMTTTTTTTTMTASERDRERNANMKAYRGWIEPLLTETNWAAFRRNIVVGERMMQLTKVVGQGVLLMTKELSGSKLHLTFTNNEWEDFINGLGEGRWDHTIKWYSEPLAKRGKEGESMLVTELTRKFGTQHWFDTTTGYLTSQEHRRISLRNSARSIEQQQQSSSSNISQAE